MHRRGALESALRILAPRIPGHEAESVIDHALVSPGLQTASPEAAIWLSLIAYIRHNLTEYDTLLDEEGYDAESARHFVHDDIDDVLAAWASPRRLPNEHGELE
jgi:hypothetical protein